MTAGHTTTVTAIVLAWGAEPLLGECVRSLLQSTDVALDVLVVDNGSPTADLDPVRDLDRVRILTPGANLGFAGGCNLGAAEASGAVLLFLNSDARVAPDCAVRLVEALRGDVGLATASVRLWNQPDTVNSAGNPWHYSGIVWAGGLDQPVTRFAEDRDVMCASGATMAIRRDLWTELGGFDGDYFAYHEDAELSLRIWQTGRRVRYVSSAISYHHYEFSRNPRKQYLLERNRLLTLLTHYEVRTLLVLAPILAVLDLGVLAVAAKQGWATKKLSGYLWLVREQQHWRSRRRMVQAQRTVSDRQLSGRFAATIDAAVLGDMPGLSIFNRVLAGYWAIARRLLSR